MWGRAMIQGDMSILQHLSELRYVLVRQKLRNIVQKYNWIRSSTANILQNLKKCFLNCNLEFKLEKHFL